MINGGQIRIFRALFSHICVTFRAITTCVGTAVYLLPNFSWFALSLDVLAMEAFSEAADYISDGDIISENLRSNQNW